MKSTKLILCISLALLIAANLALPSRIMAAGSVAQTPQGLRFAQLKITGDEFIVLYNNSTTEIEDMSEYWLQAFNNVNPSHVGTSVSTQQLPATTLQPYQTLLLSATPMATCGASIAGKLAISLGDSGGFMQLSKAGMSEEGTFVQTPSDYVSWSSGATGLIQSVPTASKSPRSVYFRTFDGIGYVWQPADLDSSNICQLHLVVAGGLGPSTAVTPLTLAATSPPATILGEINSGVSGPKMPAANIGLMAPQLSELLPNPLGTKNDATDEFIELYNPNDKPFELTGFTLQTGLTTAKVYTFPEGAMLPPKAFKVFTPEQTKLTLSNTSSQAALIDPFGNVLAVSEAYKTAKDGISWVNAGGKWQWSAQPTPGAANVIKQPASGKATTKKSATAKKITAKTTSKGSINAASVAGDHPDEAASESVIHTKVLALVGGLALLYGAYEYRRDLANRLQQLRTKLGSRRATRKTIEG